MTTNSVCNLPKIQLFSTKNEMLANNCMLIWQTAVFREVQVVKVAK